MIRTTWRAGSLRFWVFVAMALTALPLALSAILGYVILHRGIVADFQDVARRQRDQIQRNQRLQLELWEATDPVLLYLDDSDPSESTAYRQVREKIETGFARLHDAVRREPEARTLVERARDDWTQADRLAGDILSRHWPPGDRSGADEAKRFETTIAASIDRLSALESDLTRYLEADYQDADRSYERSEWVAGIAAAVSLVLMAAGVFVIGRFLLVSVDRLVEGAARFADGDRDHRIEVHVPPELSRVADEFNRMILRIKDSEAALADLARRDRLTGVLNRRAMDEALTDAMARRKRLNEDVSVLVIDIDRFKQINDRHGHAFGDEVLKSVARTIVASVREIDKVFRMGGEEFVVLLNDTSRSRAVETAERVRAAVADRPVSAAGESLPVTISIGVAVARDETESAPLLAAADAALYRAKHEGRNRVC